MADFEKLKQSMGELDEDSTLEILKEIMEDGGTGAEEAMKACQEGLNLVGDLFEQGEYFVGDLIFAGELMSQAVDILSPALTTGGGAAKGRMIMCTVKDDLHDIGKNIVISMLQASGFEVLDLGIDVDWQVIVDEAKKNNIRIIALSGVLTLAIDSMKETVKAFEEAGLRETTKIIIGGAPVSAEACAHVGADAWAHNPQDTIRICSEWAAGGGLREAI